MLWILPQVIWVIKIFHTFAYIYHVDHYFHKMVWNKQCNLFSISIFNGIRTVHLSLIIVYGCHIDSKANRKWSSSITSNVNRSSGLNEPSDMGSCANNSEIKYPDCKNEVEELPAVLQYKLCEFWHHTDYQNIIKTMYNFFCKKMLDARIPTTGFTGTAGFVMGWPENLDSCQSTIAQTRRTQN